jgi:simple sugar transport system substrate-binding protein
MRHGKLRGAVALVLILAVALAAVALIAGCGGRSTDTASPSSSAASSGVSVTKIAVITPEKGNDYGWNQQGVEGAKAAAAAVGAECIVQDGAGYGDITPILNQLAAEGPQLIFPWASGYNTVGPQVAQQEGIAMTASDPGTESANVPNLVQAVETNGQNGGYLAGVLAGKTSMSGTIAIVVSAEDLNWSKAAGGFVAGARSVAPDIKVLYVQIGQAAYADAAGGKRVTASAISGGADVVFGMGDGSSFGMMQAVETATPPAGADKVWFIDIIGDKSSTDTKGVLLSSVLWDWEPFMTEAIAMVEDGTFGQESFYLDLDNGMGLLQTDKIPADVWSEIETAKAGVLDGSIEVPLATSSKEVKALINAGQ